MNKENKLKPKVNSDITSSFNTFPKKNPLSRKIFKTRLYSHLYQCEGDGDKNYEISWSVF